MNRRELIKELGFATVFLGLLGNTAMAGPEIVVPTDPKRKPLTIAQIVAVSYPAVLKYHLQGTNWVGPQLRQMEREGRIVHQPLGPIVECDGKPYEISEISVPHVWTKKDEVMNPTEHNRIELAKQLIENGLHSHDHVILYEMEKRKASKLIVSKQYRYDRSETVEIPSQNAYVFKVYTALCFID